MCWVCTDSVYLFLSMRARARVCMRVTVKICASVGLCKRPGLLGDEAP